MISIEQINGEIAVLEEEVPTHAIMQKLSALYTVRDHMSVGESVQGVSVVVSGVVPDIKSTSRFSELISGKPTEDVLMIVDELVSTVRVVNPGLYDAVIRKLSDL